MRSRPAKQTGIEGKFSSNIEDQSAKKGCQRGGRNIFLQIEGGPFGTGTGKKGDGGGGPRMSESGKTADKMW